MNSSFRSLGYASRAGVHPVFHEGDAEDIFRHACKLKLEGIVSKLRRSSYRSGRSPHWIKMKNPDCDAVRRETEEDWRPRPIGARR